MLAENLANKINVLCQKIKNLANRNAHAFLAIDDLSINSIDLPANSELPLELTDPTLAQSKYFKLVTVSFNNGIMINNWAVLKYVGKKKAKFLFTTSANIEYTGSEGGPIIRVQFFLAIGKNGGTPEIVEPRLIKEFARFDNGDVSTETMNGIFYLHPNDTLGIIFMADAPLMANTFIIDAFMRSLVQIA